MNQLLINVFFAAIHYASTYVVPPPANPSLKHTSSSVPVGLSTRCYDEPSESGAQQPVFKAIYKDPDCDSEMRPKTKGPVCADQLVYNQVEELSMGGAKGPVQDNDNGNQQPSAYLSVPVGHQASGHDKTLKSAAYRDPDFDSELKSKLKGPVCADQPVYNQVEELSMGGAKGPVQDNDNGNQQPSAYLSVPVGHQASGHDKTLKSAAYRDPDFDSELKSKLKGPVCAEQPVYNHMEELSVQGVVGPAKGSENGIQQPVCTAEYKDPDLDSELRPKKKGLVCAEQPVYNHVEDLPVREAKRPAKGRENGTQKPLCTAVYKDPDLDNKLRSKKKGPVCVQQPVYHHMEQLSVRGAKGGENGTQQPVCKAVYKDPDFDNELRRKKNVPVCAQQPVYNHMGRKNNTQPEYNVLESYLECSKRPSQYGTMLSSAELVFDTMEKSKPDDAGKPNDS